MSWQTFALYIFAILFCLFLAVVITMGMARQIKKRQEYKHRNVEKMPRPVKLEKNVSSYDRMKWAQEPKARV